MGQYNEEQLIADTENIKEQYVAGELNAWELIQSLEAKGFTRKEAVEEIYELDDDLNAQTPHQRKLPITGTEPFTEDSYRFHAERAVVDAIFHMACHALDPEQMGQLDEILEHLCIMRDIPRSFRRPGSSLN